MVLAGNVNMFFTESGDKYLLLQLTVLHVVIKARFAGPLAVCWLKEGI